MNTKYKILLPLLFALLLATGIFIGARLNYSNQPIIRFLQPSRKASDKINSILNFIEENYVDTIKKEDLIEKAIPEILYNLDPHSVYVSAKETQAMHEPLEGNFEGIGIEFNITKDTLRVVSVISGGPSEELGIQAGDKIIAIDGKNVAGISITNKDVLSKLRGKGGTKVNVGILRGHSTHKVDYLITRGTIPIFSVDVSYMLNKKTGYIKVSRFAETTFDEFQEHAAKLRAKGMENLVLDLRGNGGGFLSTAVKICDEFLDNEQVIVSTEGKAHPKEIMTATGSGILGHIHLAILIDENSASASEIVAGAIQDNDRGIIIGRRSFGKGLVQREVMLSDSSAIRLTIARYYTPTGRCIQKPYDNLQEYYKEEYYRSLSGELLHEDSIHHKDSLKFVTPKGKTVYGGGGITPDVFVPIDTAGQTSFLSDLFTKGLINQYSFSYADKNRNTLLKEGYDSYYKNFTIDGRMLNDFLSFSYSQGVKKNIPELERSKHIIKNLLKAGIARQIWKNDGFFPILYQNDREIQKAIEELNKNTPL